jgi:biopolymer transport protein ExbB/TolQ
MPSAAHLTPVAIFAHAATGQKLIAVVLLVSIVAAISVAALKLKDGQRLSGGSAFLSGLRVGGPILGGLGGCASLLSMSMGYANVPGEAPLKVLAPGFAETFFMVELGFLAGVVAVLAHWAVEARVDRSVLKA